jgi:coatomer subunit gamma
VKRWHTEIQTATRSQDVMVQYHALALLYKLRQHDRLAIIKLITQLTSAGLRSPYANCLLIRYMADLIPVVSEEYVGECELSVFLLVLHRVCVCVVVKCGG